MSFLKSRQHSSVRPPERPRAPLLRNHYLDRAVAECSSAILRPEGGLESAIEVVLRLTDSDAVFVDRVVENDSYGPCSSTLAEVSRWREERTVPFSWSDPETGETIPNGFPYLLAPTLHRSLAAGAPVFVSVQELAEGAERALFLEMGVVHQYAVPLLVDSRWVGSLGVRRYRRWGRWNRRDIRLLHRVAEIFATALERRALNERIDHLLDSKEELITGIAHQLRTPLTGLVGLSQFLEGGERLDQFDPEEISAFLRDLHSSVRDLASVVENIVVAARSDHRTILLVPEEVELRTLVDAEVRDIFHAAKDRVAVSGEPAYAFADRRRVRQIVRNLLLNALQHGGKRVDVRVAANDEATITISDDGLGIPGRFADSIFTKFEKGKPAANGTPSLGLGLTVAWRLAWMMGGDLSYQRCNDGSRFTLTLPSRRGSDPSTATDLQDHPGYSSPGPASP